MEIINDRLVYSATDLVGFLECGHLTSLERAAVSGHLERPVRSDPVLDRIAQRGQLHEERFLDSLLSEGFRAVRLEPDPALPRDQRLAKRRDETLAAMRAGADVVYQAALFDGRRLGFSDFLRRVEQASDLGPWSYEVWDTKLARHAKASAVLQLCMYSDLLQEYQGLTPAEMHLALGGAKSETVSFRVADYAAYHRQVAREFETVLNEAPVHPLATTPEPVEHCGVCRWSDKCGAQWRAEDDLSLVAGLASRQRSALHSIGVSTRSKLAEPIHALSERLDGIGRDALQRIHAQASIQVRGEHAGAVISERIGLPRDREGDLVPNQGLLMLPGPSPGDLFFDMEGDPFFSSDEVDGIEHLFGVIEPGSEDESGQPAFHKFWSIEDSTVTTTGERRAFEAFMDLVMDRLAVDPSLHIYHYAPVRAHRRKVPSRPPRHSRRGGGSPTGKSTVGAEMIVDLVNEGWRVGVTANSHKVIGELLTKVAEAADERGVRVRIGQRSNDEPTFGGAVHMENNDAARDSLAADSVDVLGGTTWLWSREDMIGGVDILFIDEAGQMSLADAVAASLCTRNLVLLGDPQQLDQPLQGTHPPGAERSVLGHVLHGERVMPDQFGLFLDGSWRLHPRISSYTSEIFYEGRLHSYPGRESLDLAGVPPLSGTGIRFLPVPHSGRSSESPEEAREVARLVRDLLSSDPTYRDAEGIAHSLEGSDVLLITPYNAQVRSLSEAQAVQYLVADTQQSSAHAAHFNSAVYSCSASIARGRQENPRGRSAQPGLCTKASSHKPVTIKLVRRHLWMSSGGFSMSRRDSDSEKVPAALYDRLTDTPTYAARMYKVQPTSQPFIAGA